MQTHKDKMRVVHAIWAVSTMPNTGVEDWMQLASKLLKIPIDKLFVDFDYDYTDRAFCSRPHDWTIVDSYNYLLST